MLTPSPDNATDYPRLRIARTATALAAHLREAPAATVISPDPAAGGLRGWWPLLEMCADDSVASVIAGALVEDLPADLHVAAPDAATLLTGALHAAALVGWPPVTIAHILDAGAVATIVELLGVDGDDDLALCVAAAAGDLAADHQLVRYAAAVAARPLLAASAAIVGPPAPTPPGAGVWREVRGARSATLIVHTADTVIGGLIASRLTYLEATAAADAAARRDRGSVA